MSKVFPTRRRRPLPKLPAPLATKTLLIEARGILDRYARAKEALKRLDQITMILKNADLSGTGWEVKDNFPAGTNTAFRPAAVSRYQLQPVKPGRKS